MSDTPALPEHPDLAALHADLAQCRRCAEAGFHIDSQPIFSGTQEARLMVIGQAPGISERGLGYPFGGDAGRRLFRWLARAGWDEPAFRGSCYITSVTKCYPGRSPTGSGDRVPSTLERRLCRPWLEGELALVQPEVIVPVGMLAIGLFYGRQASLSEVIGTSIVDAASRRIVPLPHPSGASRWFNDPGNVARLERALDVLRAIKVEMSL
jgi:uracil-DNA glycosylase